MKKHKNPKWIAQTCYDCNIFLQNILGIYDYFELCQSCYDKRYEEEMRERMEEHYGSIMADISHYMSSSREYFTL